MKRKLVEVKEPELLEDIFPYDLPPRIVFDGEHVDMEDISNRTLRISDTTFRDGQQARPPYEVDQIVKLFNLISKISGPNGVIDNSEFFVYSPKDRKAIMKCMEEGNEFPRITAWIRGLEDDIPHLKWLAKAGIKETGLLTSSSDYHTFHKMKKDRRKAFNEYISMVKRTLDMEIRPRCHLEDVTRADIYGFVVPFVQELMEISKEYDDSLGVKIRLCDTMGFGVPQEQAVLPRSVPKLVYVMRHEAGVPSERLEWHGHNDFNKVHANATAAWYYGCDILNSTLCGYGERTGNPPMEAAVFEYMSLKGTKDGMDTKALTEAADYLRSIGVVIAPDKPIVGKEAFTTRAGVHAVGMREDERIYAPYNPKVLLDQELEILLTDKSGPEGVALYATRFLRAKGLLGEDEKIRMAEAVDIIKWWNAQYKGGRNTVISREEMEAKIREHLPQYFESAR